MTGKGSEATEAAYKRPRSWQQMREQEIRWLIERTGDELKTWNVRVRESGIGDEAGLRTWLAEKGVTGAGQANRVSLDRTAELLDLIDGGRIKAPETTVLPLEQAGDAIDTARAKHTRGKVVIRVS